MIDQLGVIAKGMAPFRGFLLTFITLTGLFALAFIKDVDIATTLPIVLGIYIGAKTGEKASAHMAASRDSSCDTAAVIAAVTEK